MWPLECKQEFLKILPDDLVFDQTWHIFELSLDIVKTNILTKFHIKNGSQIWPIECKKSPKIWPGDLVFLTNRTHTQIWPRYCQYKTICLSFIKIVLQMWPLECKQEFPKIWTCDLVFDQTWHIFEVCLDIVKTNILTKFNQNRVANVASRVLTIFSKNWPGDLVFDPIWHIFELSLDIVKSNNLTKFL